MELTGGGGGEYDAGVMRTNWTSWLAGIAAAAALWAGTAASQGAEKPWVEDKPPREWHLFLRPKMKDAGAQWAYVQELQRAGKGRKAARQARALRAWWPRSAEAPEAQMLVARWRDGKGDWEGAFEAYQVLLEEYGTQCDFGAVLETQLRLANAILSERRCAWLGMKGFESPERAVPYYEQIAAVAPEWEGTAEALFRKGQAQEKDGKQEEAIESYFQTMNRFPESPFAADAAVGQARCHVTLADERPSDARARDLAVASCDLVLARWPNSPRRAWVEREKAKLLERRKAAAWQLALYYDEILKNAEAAKIHYREFAALYPEAPEAARAAARLAELQRTDGKGAKK